MGVNACLTAYSLGAFFLYYNQAVTETPAYESDLPAHIRMAVEDGWAYSLTAFFYRIFYAGQPGGNRGAVLTALFLMLATVASVFLTALLLHELPAGKRARLRDLSMEELFAGLLCNLVMPCFVTGIADGRYIGMQSASIWHNSTYLVMKPLGLLCLILYLRLMRDLSGLQAGSWSRFAAALVVTTAVKPSFLLAFAPAMLLFLILDLLKGVPFRKLFYFGCAVLPSLLVILVQNAVLFGSDTGNSFVFAPGEALRLHSAHPLVAAGLSILFPLWMLAGALADGVFGKKTVWKKEEAFLWVMAFVGFGELFFFTESGSRALDGNFSWGYAFTILPLFVWALMRALRGAAGELRSAPASPEGERALGAAALLRRGYLVMACIFFCWHLYCGLVFFLRLIRGVSYFMWT
ncbi:MAG: hypothetical protein IKS07_03905 [Lachnospiraceae bacterium]|nr:hypothetical protein [Lachnospiraceae bacterium]